MNSYFGGCNLMANGTTHGVSNILAAKLSRRLGRFAGVLHGIFEVWRWQNHQWTSVGFYQFDPNGVPIRLGQRTNAIVPSFAGDHVSDEDLAKNATNVLGMSPQDDSVRPLVTRIYQDPSASWWIIGSKRSNASPWINVADGTKVRIETAHAASEPLKAVEETTANDQSREGRPGAFSDRSYFWLQVLETLSRPAGAQRGFDLAKTAKQLFGDLREALGARSIMLFSTRQVDGNTMLGVPVVLDGKQEDGEADNCRFLSLHVEFEKGQQTTQLVARRPTNEIDTIVSTLVTDDEPFGVIAALFDRAAGDDGANSSTQTVSVIQQPHRMMLSVVASTLSLRGSNIKLRRESDQTLTETVRALVNAIEAKDEYTRGHSERVALYAQCLATSLNSSAIDRERIYLTGLVHDIGKIGIQDVILSKPDSLSEREYQTIKQHPDLGWSIIHEIKRLHYTLPGILHHHEQFDGSGYPDGLVGTAIPESARILAIADSFDAMTSDRPYRVGQSIESAFQILHEGAGRQWDPDLVERFVSLKSEIELIKRFYQLPIRPMRRKQ